jgi:hypothetical protein
MLLFLCAVFHFIFYLLFGIFGVSAHEDVDVDVDVDVLPRGFETVCDVKKDTSQKIQGKDTRDTFAGCGFQMVNGGV